MKHQWVKQLTRENTLLDRSLRHIAYAKSIKPFGQASISNCLIVGQGAMTSLYYDQLDYQRQQQIIMTEFRGSGIKKTANYILQGVEQGYFWATAKKNLKLSKKEFVNYLKSFNKYHAFGRGAITYGYWGEPRITARLKKALAKKVAKNKLDATLSTLSAPKIISGKLSTLYHPPVKIDKEKQKLIIKLKLSKSEKELVEILSWFTLFYEIGERVSSFLYDELMKHLKKIVKNKKTLAELNWYDADSLINFFKGKKISNAERRRRQTFYILKIIDGQAEVISGYRAKNFYEKNLAEKVVANVTELAGTVASTGKVRGTVRIVMTQADQAKMKKGDILVSPMTTPRLMTAITKAAAIVTDEGGMTAHAAIVSRELKIPCVVGTKFATRVFKDGDLVEVNANEGVIKKI